MSAPTHFVTFDLEGFRPGDRPKLTCTSPADAMCRAVWTCACEQWFKFGVEDGKPWHVPGDYSEPEYERHVGTFDPNECVYVDWADNSDECLGGIITIPVEPEHHGDYVTFHAVPGSVEVQA